MLAEWKFLRQHYHLKHQPSLLNVDRVIEDVIAGWVIRCAIIDLAGKRGCRDNVVLAGRPIAQCSVVGATLLSIGRSVEGLHLAGHILIVQHELELDALEVTVEDISRGRAPGIRPDYLVRWME